jgi:queuosine precursor transporter
LEDVIKVAFTQYVLKTLWEVLMTPFTYRIVAFLKKREHEDYYDHNTNFSPFHIQP